jgi:uncharacterized protein
VAVTPVEAEAPCTCEFGIGDRDRFASFDRRLNRLTTASLGVAVRARARETQRTEFESGTDPVLEEHLDVRSTVDFDGFDVMLGHVASVPSSAAAHPLSPVRPSSIRWPWLRNRWDDLAFVHWRYPAGEVQALLPEGVRVDTFDGDAWVSLVPFRMRRAGPTFLPPIPWISSFAETNVRTYVVDSAGDRAVWFLSLDATRLPVVAFARWAIGFPYVWSSMSIDRCGSRWTYTTSRRRWPARPSATTRVVVDVGAPIEPTDLDVFLTARWGTVALHGRHLRHHPVDHPPWVLREATLVSCDDSAVEAAGLNSPSGTPLVRAAESLDARFARPARV